MKCPGKDRRKMRLCKIVLVVMVSTCLLFKFFDKRKGEYFQSTKRAYRLFGVSGASYEPQRTFSCLEAGLVTLPTVIGPAFFWVYRPVYDTIDLLVISPIWDVLCLPWDHYLKHNFIFHLNH